MFTWGHTPATLIVVNLVISCVMGLTIGLVYNVLHRGYSYSSSFARTIVILCPIITIVMMVIGNNLAMAFGLVGALSIIRFRTAIKDSQDVAFIFFSLSAGMASGTGNYMLAGISVILVLAFYAFLMSTGFGSNQRHDYLLKIRFSGGEQDETAFKSAFSDHVKSHTLVNVTSIPEAERTEAVYNVVLRQEDGFNAFVNALYEINGVERAVLISAQGAAEA